MLLDQATIITSNSDETFDMKETEPHCYGQYKGQNKNCEDQKCQICKPSIASLIQIRNLLEHYLYRLINIEQPNFLTFFLILNGDLQPNINLANSSRKDPMKRIFSDHNLLLTFSWRISMNIPRLIDHHTSCHTLRVRFDILVSPPKQKLVLSYELR